MPIWPLGLSRLLEGRDVIRTQGVWALGDGHTIRSFNDTWVPLLSSFRIKPREGAQLGDTGRVRDWIDSADQTWNEPLVRDAVNLEDVDVVLHVTIPIVRGPDG